MDKTLPQRLQQPLPSPLTTPVVPNEEQQQQQPIPRARKQQQQQHHGRHSLSANHKIKKDEQNVDEKLRTLLGLLNQKNDGGGSVAARAPSAGGDGDGTTLEYLSQLEDAARRLKDQLMNEQPKVEKKIENG